MRYLGAKTSLLTEIESILEPHISSLDLSMMDVFAGTNAVGKHFAEKFSMKSNDNLRLSYMEALSYLEGPEFVTFEELRRELKLDPVAYLNTLGDEQTNTNDGYYERTFSAEKGPCYLTVENAKRVGMIREKIDEWSARQVINRYEEGYLITALLKSISKVSNTTGTYGAYLKHWDPRALKKLRLVPEDLQQYKNQHKAYNEDVNDFVAKVGADIAYVDPPYNNRQYASNYHLLENVARHDKPEVRGITRIFDWKDLRSEFSQKKKAYGAIDKLLEGLQAEHLVFSYNTEGIVPVSDLIALVEKHSVPDSLEYREIPYRKYQSKIPSAKKDLKEVLIYSRLGKRPTPQRRKMRTATVKTAGYQHGERLVKSPVNYIGGKYRLLPQILPLFPPEIRTFVDLFSGGANVGINVNAQKHLFNDMNVHVNGMFRAFQEMDSAEIVDRVEAYIDEWQLSKTNQEAYLNFRAHYNSEPDPIKLYVLAAYGYNYQFRFNSRQEFNNPFGRNRSHFSPTMKSNLIAFSERLHSLNARFVDYYFDELDLSVLDSRDFVYADPPYILSTGSYNDGARGFKDWSEAQEQGLYEKLGSLSVRGVRWALSNVLEHKGERHMQLERFIEKQGANVHYLDHNYSNSSYNTSRKSSIEVLITNY